MFDSTALLRRSDCMYRRRKYLSVVVDKFAGTAFEPALARLSERLDYLKVNEHPPLGSYSQSNDDWISEQMHLTPEERDKILIPRVVAPVNKDDPSLVDQALTIMAGSSERSRRQSQVWRAAQQAKWAEQRGWYPVFDTLTIDNSHYSHAVDVVTQGWTDYKRAITREVGRQVYGSWRQASKHPQSDYVHHMCVVEQGKRTGRLHLHVLWFFRDLPQSWRRDPNAYDRTARKRSITAMRKYWPFGFVTEHIAVRTHPGDVYGQLGWTWPVDKRTNKGLRSSTLDAIGAYMSKYMSKSFGYRFRTRFSRGFGVQKLREQIWQIASRRQSRWLLRPMSSIREMEYPVTHRSLIRIPPLLLQRESRRIRRLVCLQAHPTLTAKRIILRRSLEMVPLLRKLSASPDTTDVELMLSRVYQEYLQVGGCYKRRQRASEVIELVFDYPRPPKPIIHTPVKSHGIV